MFASPLWQRRLASLLLLVMLLGADAAFAVAYAHEQGRTGLHGGTASLQGPVPVPPPVPAQPVGGFTCNLTGLSDLESQRLLDLVNDGFQGREIGSDEPAPDEREKLENATILAPVDKEQAIKVELQDQKFDPREAQHLAGDFISGPYSFGLVLDDTLRIGRCNDLEDRNAPCPVTENRLRLRNSGEGIKENVTNAWGVLASSLPFLKDKRKEDLDEEDYEKIRESMGLEGEAGEEFKENLAFEDADETDLRVVTRVPGKPIKNSILTDNFDAFLQTPCTSSACIISVYSLFDKYYNSFFAADMVLGLGVPTLWHRARKLFPWMQRLNFTNFRISQTEFMNKIRRQFANPQSIMGKRRIRNVNTRANKFPHISKMHLDLVEPTQWSSGYYLVKSGEWREWWRGKMTTKGGLLDQIKDPKEKEELFKYMRDLRGFSRTQNAMLDISGKEYARVVQKYGHGSPREIAARIDHARNMNQIMLSWDDSFRLDMPEWWFRDESSNLHKYAVKVSGQEDYKILSHDSANGQRVMKKFIRDGHFGGDWGKGIGKYGETTYESAGRNLILYEPVPVGKGLTVTPDGLEKNLAQYTDKVVRTDKGEFIRANASSIPYIRKNVSVKAEIYDVGWRKAMELSPEEWAQRSIHPRTTTLLGPLPESNTNEMYNTLIDRGFAKRGYTSLLDRAMSRQDELVKDYFSLRGGAKWTLYTYAYWWGKRGQIGDVATLEGFSAYMLPESLRTVRWPLGQGPLYNDAFIDFFSNAGSDDGDLFMRMIENLPVAWLYKNAAANFEPVEETYNAATAGGKRTRVENIALFSSSDPNCTDCGVTVGTQRNFTSFPTTFFSDRATKNFILEDPATETAKEKGTLLIAFSYHTDLLGEEEGVDDTGEILLSEAVKKRESCRDKVIELGQAVPFAGGQVGAAAEYVDPSLVGGVLAFTETMGYAIFGWSGLFGTLAQQIIVVPSIQDCVDVEGGYYTHVFMPSKKKSEETGDAAQLSTETFTEGLTNLSDAMLDVVKGEGDSNSTLAQTLQELDSQARDFIDDSAGEVVQATVETELFTTGQVEGKQLFSFWFQGETAPTTLKTQGRKVLGDPDQNVSVEVDFEEGTITAVKDKDGVTEKTLLVDNPLVTRLASTNTNIPAEELPKRLTLLGLPGTEAPLFDIALDGELFVRNSEAMECIRRAVLDQTGVPLTDPEALSQAFGSVLSLSTDQYATVKLWEAQQRIVAEGTPRRMVEGADAHVAVLANRATFLRNSQERAVGLLDSIQFENGVILYDPESGALVIWLKRHERGQLSQDDVSGLQVAQAASTNPATGCVEPAFNLSAVPVPGSEAIELRVGTFNNALSTVGPFQVFETPSRRYSFFSKLENGACVDFFRILDKATGEVRDIPIAQVFSTPEGITVVGTDGSTNTLNFSASDGVPTLSFNDGLPETLLAAQGRNGSFWFDPERGAWYAENANLLPLIEAFRRGSLTQPGPGGTVVARPGDNIVNINPSAGGFGAFNLPGPPEEPLLLLLFTLLVLAGFLVVQRRFA